MKSVTYRYDVYRSGSLSSGGSEIREEEQIIRRHPSLQELRRLNGVAELTRPG